MTANELISTTMFMAQTAINTTMIAEEEGSRIPIYMTFPGACFAIEAERQRQLVVLAKAPAEAVTLMKQKRTALRNNQHQHLIHVLLRGEIGNRGRLCFVCVQEVSDVFDINCKTCWQIWRRYLQIQTIKRSMGDMLTWKSNSGKMQNPLSDLETIKDILHAKRADYRSMSAESGIPVLRTLWH